MGIPIRGLKRKDSTVVANLVWGLKNGNPDQGIETEVEYTGEVVVQLA